MEVLEVQWFSWLHSVVVLVLVANECLHFGVVGIELYFGLG